MVHFYFWASNEWVMWIVIKCQNSAWSSWKSHSTEIARIGMKRTSRKRRRKTKHAHAYTVWEASGKSNMMWSDFILNDKTNQKKNSTSIAYMESQAITRNMLNDEKNERKLRTRHIYNSRCDFCQPYFDAHTHTHTRQANTVQKSTRTNIAQLSRWWSTE